MIALGKETRVHRPPIVSTTAGARTPHGINGNPEGVVACRSRSTPVGSAAVRNMRADKFCAPSPRWCGTPPRGMVGRRSRIASRTRAKLHLDFRLPCMRPPPASLSYHRAHLSAAARCVEIPLGIPFTVAQGRWATARSRDVRDDVGADDIDDDRFMGVGLVQIFYSSVEL